MHSGGWAALGSCRFSKKVLNSLNVSTSGLVDSGGIGDLAAPGLRSPEELKSRCPCRGYKCDCPTHCSPLLHRCRCPAGMEGTKFGVWGRSEQLTPVALQWQGTVDARWIKTSFEPSVFTVYWEKSFFIETKCSPTLLTCCLRLLKQPRFDPWLEVSSAPGSMAFFCPMSLSSCDECSQGF